MIATAVEIALTTGSPGPVNAAMRLLGRPDRQRRLSGPDQTHTCLSTMANAGRCASAAPLTTY